MEILRGAVLSEGSSKSGVSGGAAPKDFRPVTLDDVDRRILTALHRDARLSNNALADLVGIA
ncbi:AsnC family transcriptional regulator, partial [Mycolicibacterium fallax]